MYKIIRSFLNSWMGEGRPQTIKTGLTLEEAQAHCKDPETSSSTCTSDVGKRRTERMGPWFDGYEEE